MKNTIKLGLVAAGSFVLGYLVSNRRNESYYFDEAQRSADAIEEENEKIFKGLNKEIAELRERLSNYVITEPPAGEADAPEDVEAAAAAALTDYQGGRQDYHKRHEKIAEEVKKVDPAAPKTETYMIEEEEFRLNANGYEQIPLMYYSGDNVLATTMGDNVVNEPGRSYALGPYDVSKRELWDQHSALFLRNDSLMQDYEVDHMPTSFADEVGG